MADPQAQAARQHKTSDRPTGIPTGEAVGNPESEQDRILRMMRGEPLRDEDLSPSSKESLSPNQDDTLVTEEGRQTLEELLSERERMDDNNNMDTADATEGDQVIEIGGTKVPLSTVETWKDSWENSQTLADRQRELEEKNRKDQEMWRESLVALRNDPVGGLRALGLTDEQIRQHLGGNDNSSNDDGFGDLEFDSDSAPEYQAVARQNKALKNQLDSLIAQQKELANQMAQEKYTKQQQEAMEWHNNRSSAAKEYVDGIVKKASNLDAQGKALLRKAVFTEIENGVDDAPLDDAGLQAWAKGRLKATMDEVSMGDIASAATAPRRSSIPTKAGSTPESTSKDNWDKVNIYDDDSRKKGALAWLEAKARKS